MDIELKINTNNVLSVIKNVYCATTMALAFFVNLFILLTITQSVLVALHFVNNVLLNKYALTVRLASIFERGYAKNV